MTPTPYEFIGGHEGQVPHMYLDTEGLVTAGVGFMLPDLAAARRLPWYPPGAVDIDWSVVRKQPKGLPATAYRRVTVARLAPADMEREFNARLILFEAALLKALPAWRSYPDAVRLALLDMAWNLGAGFIVSKDWPRLRAAVLARNWDECAIQCHRKERPTPGGVQASRNTATAALFRSCAFP